MPKNYKTLSLNYKPGETRKTSRMAFGLRVRLLSALALAAAATAQTTVCKDDAHFKSNTLVDKTLCSDTWHGTTFDVAKFTGYPSAGVVNYFPGRTGWNNITDEEIKHKKISHTRGECCKDLPEDDAKVSCFQCCTRDCSFGTFKCDGWSCFGSCSCSNLDEEDGRSPAVPFPFWMAIHLQPCCAGEVRGVESDTNMCKDAADFKWNATANIVLPYPVGPTLDTEMRMSCQLVNLQVLYVGFKRTNWTADMCTDASTMMAETYPSVTGGSHSGGMHLDHTLQGLTMKAVLEAAGPDCCGSTAKTRCADDLPFIKPESNPSTAHFLAAPIWSFMFAAFVHISSIFGVV